MNSPELHAKCLAMVGYGAKFTKNMFPTDCLNCLDLCRELIFANPLTPLCVRSMINAENCMKYQELHRKLIFPNPTPMGVGQMQWHFFCWKLHKTSRFEQKIHLCQLSLLEGWNANSLINIILLEVA